MKLIHLLAPRMASLYQMSPTLGKEGRDVRIQLRNLSTDKTRLVSFQRPHPRSRGKGEGLSGRPGTFDFLGSPITGDALVAVARRGRPAFCVSATIDKHATQRWQRAKQKVGYGHLYQGRFKSFPVETDEHFYTVMRYVERNALRANLVRDGGSVAMGQFVAAHEQRPLAAVERLAAAGTAKGRSRSTHRKRTRSWLRFVVAFSAVGWHSANRPQTG
jgi:hypothetical protein